VLCNEGTAEQIVKAGLVEMLFQHMGDKKEDDEFVLQARRLHVLCEGLQ
jgi:hypothetical protein